MIYLITKEPVISNEYKDAGYDFINLCTTEEAIDYLKKQEILGVDIETSGFFPQTDKMLLFQVGDERVQFVFDCLTVDITPLKDILESKVIILHNGKFDLRFLYIHGIYPRTNVYDTYLAEAVLNCGIISVRKGLDKVVERYCGITLDKSTRGKIHYLDRLDPEILIYAANDVKYLKEVKESQEYYLEQMDLIRTVQLDNLTMPAIAYIEYQGFKLDEKAWKEKMEKDQETLDYCLAELNRLGEIKGFTEVNWMSPQQVIKVFDSLGVDLMTKEGKKSVDTSVLLKQLQKYESDESTEGIRYFIESYLNYRKAAKIVSTYGESLLKIAEFFPDRRIRTTYSQIMRTGRMSSGGSQGKGKDKLQLPNMQNIPRKGAERQCFVPEEGNVFIVADYSGQENLILADFSQDKEFYAYQTDSEKDIHAFHARLIYQEKLGELSDLDIKKNYPEERQFAKGATFAFSYGGTDYTIRERMSLPVEVAKRVYEGYKRKFPGLQKYFTKKRSETLKNGYILINPTSGRKSFIPKFKEFKQELKKCSLGLEYDKTVWRKKGAIERSSQNYPIQGTGADMIKLSLFKMYEWITEKGFWGTVKICNVVHDEIVVECPEHMSEEVSQALLSIMKESANKFCSTVPVNVGYEIGNKWTH